MKGNTEESCLSCKVISVTSLFGIGGYLFYLAKSQPKSRYLLLSLGAVSTALGAGEVFDKSPFRSSD